MLFSPMIVRRPAHASFQWASGHNATEPMLETTDQGFALSLDVPGLDKSQLHIEIDQRVLRIQSKDDAPRAFRAAYRLPQAIDAAASSAKLEHGVLSVQLVRMAPVSSAHTVRID